MEDEINDCEYAHSDLTKCGITIKSKYGPIVEGIVKARFCDFYVKEIGLDNIPTTLDTLKFEEKITEEIQNEVDFLKIPKNILEELELFNQNQDLKEIKIKCENDKNIRTIIHVYIRTKYQSLVSKTNQADSTEIIVNKFNDQKSLAHSQNDRWNKNLPEYTEFFLYKENMSTNDAISFLSNSLRVNEKNFTYAGIKDKRGITVQRVSAHRIHPQKIISCMEKYYKNRAFHESQIILGNFVRKSQPLKLGDLNGNLFQIIIRDLRFPNLKNVEERDLNILKGSLDASVKNLNQFGFPNFFGKQRFGIGSVPTYLIGLSILKCDWEAAVDYILTERHKMPEKLRQAIKEWRASRDSNKAADIIRHNFRHLPESCVLNKLKLSNNKINESSLSLIVYGTQLMYLHSFQSYIWNLVLSKRVEKFGNTILKGDLLMNFSESEPRVVLAEDIPNLKSDDISNIVHPLPGFDIKYPENEIQDWYFDLYKTHGIEVSMFQHKVSRYRLPGSYRSIIIIPNDLKYNFLSYYGNEPLIQTDKDALEWPYGPKNNITEVPSDAANIKSTENKKMALYLKFGLPSSCYATTLINEIVIERKHSEE